MNILQQTGWLGQSDLLTRLPACRCFQCSNSLGPASGDSLATNSSPGTSSLSAPRLNDTVPPSGNFVIDSLSSGFRWGISTISYSFYSAFFGGRYYGRETGVGEVTNGIKNNVRLILRDYIAPYINLQFTEIRADSANNYGLIRIMFSDGPEYAYAYYPDNTNFNQFNSSDVAGDVHLTRNFENDPENSFEAGPGTYGFVTLIHELLHTLGLKHPGNYNFGGGPTEPPFLPFNLDNNTNTVMTYNLAGAQPSSMMPYDILALQYLYGASTLNAGNTTYRFITVSGFSDGSRNWGTTNLLSKTALWDSGGNDTLDFSLLGFDALGYQFDLRPGGALTSLGALNSVSYQAIGDSSGTLYPTVANGTLLGFGDTAVIENAVGTSSNDTMLGNGADNYLDGSLGNDALYGRSGSDSVFGNQGNDLIVGGAGADFLAGGLGADQIFGSNDDDQLFGGRGFDLLDGGAGNDRLTGGLGSDTFALRIAEGVASVLDFEDGVDFIRLPSGAMFGNLVLVPGVGSMQIWLGSDVLATLLNISVAQLTPADFLTA